MCRCWSYQRRQFSQSSKSKLLRQSFPSTGRLTQDASQVNLCRAARTDAGVSAAVNVVCLKLIVAPPNLPADTPLEDYLNTFLPPAIRIWAIIGVQGGFDPRHGCDQRHYEYTLPTHVFLAPKPGCAMAEWIQKSRTTKPAAPVPSTATESTIPSSEAAGTASIESTTESIIETDEIPVTDTSAEPIPTTSTSESTADDVAIASSAAFWAAQPDNSTFAMDAQAKKIWRISPELLESARKFVKAYEGSHNYYNYTVQKDFRDRSCQRVMRELQVRIRCFRAVRAILTPSFASCRSQTPSSSRIPNSLPLLS